MGSKKDKDKNKNKEKDVSESKFKETVSDTWDEIKDFFRNIYTNWNRIGYIRHIVTTINAITLILSYTCWPGIISSLYLTILMTNIASVELYESVEH